MSPQVLYALQKAAIVFVIAGLAVLLEQTTNILGEAGLDPIWYPMIIAGLAALLRIFEGWRDGKRAEQGKTIPSDVTPIYVENAVVPQRVI